MNYRFYKYNQIFEYIENINNCSIDTYKIRFSDYSTEKLLLLLKFIEN